MIENEAQARHHARTHTKDAKSLVVSSTGDIHVNGDVSEVCDQMESEGKTAFILIGERKKKRKKADTNEQPADNTGENSVTQ
jgi:hypothetical protein